MTVKRRVLAVTMVAGVLCAGVMAAAANAATAPGAPGSESYFDLARKDCVGTARNTSSKVWFTVADGALSDVYWPTIDATNVHTLQYLVSDGHSTWDNGTLTADQIIRHTNATLAGWFVQLLRADEVEYRRKAKPALMAA